MSTKLVSFDERAHPQGVKEALVEWLSVPSELRQPPTLEQWCEMHGVHRATTWRWRADPAFRRLVVERIRGRFLPHLQDLVDVAVEKARGGSVKHLELLLRHLVPEVWHFMSDDGDGDRPDLAARLVQAVTASDLGRVLAAQLQAHERARQQAQVVDAEVQDVTEEDSGEEDVEPKG